MRLFAIGDIHGCLTALEVLNHELAFGEGDTVVTLGDYVDRGPDSRGVIDFLLGLRKRCRLVALRGNHEIDHDDAGTRRPVIVAKLDRVRW